MIFVHRPRTVEVHDRTAHIEVIATIVHPPILMIEGGMGLVLARVREGLGVATIWDKLFTIGSGRGSGLGAKGGSCWVQGEC